MSNNYRLEFALPAVSDLTGIFEYISLDLDNPKAASDLMDALDEAFSNICLFPRSAPEMEETISGVRVRKLVVKNYVAFYHVLEERRIVRVVYIRYAPRDLRELFDEKK